MYQIAGIILPGDLTICLGIGATVATDPRLPLSTEVLFKNLFLKTSAEDSLRLVFAEIVELVIVESRLAQGSDLESNKQYLNIDNFALISKVKAYSLQKS